MFSEGLNFIEMKIWCAIFVTLISLVIVCSENGPKVKTNFGIHRGIWKETVRGERVASYLGIPYAKPPKGDRRFQKPVRWTQEWRRVREASRYPKSCAYFGETKERSEDCLYLNVFTRREEQYSRDELKKPNRAVLVFLISDLNGNTDNSLYSPDYLLDQDIVLVTVNYRRGVFGFFTTGDEAAPGNYGLKDVLEALHWIKENIQAFGGDPENVTLMGHDTGAGIVHLLALSEKSEGLFHRYVTQSGAAQSPQSYRPLEKAKNVSLILASTMNCSRDTSEEIVECMREVRFAETTDVLDQSEASWKKYGPTDEPDSEEAVITKHPKILMKEERILDIPWMTGVVANEGLPMSLYFEEHPEECDGGIKQLELFVFELTNNRENIIDIPAFLEELESFYFDGNFTAYCKDHFEEMAGDLLVNWPVYEALNIQVNRMKSDIYFYNFAYNGTFSSTFSVDSFNRFGVSLGDELNYLFPVHNEVYEDLLLRNTEDDTSMINIVTEMWANFTKTGVPGASFTPEWEPYKDGKGYMEFGQDAEGSMQKEFIEERMAFWSNLTEKLFIEPENPDGESNAATSLWGRNMEKFDILKNLTSLLVLLLIPRRRNSGHFDNQEFSRVCMQLLFLRLKELYLCWKESGRLWNGLIVR